MTTTNSATGRASFYLARPRKGDIMSLPKLHGTGQLVADPKTGPTKTGGTWTNAVVKFTRWAKGDGGGWVEADSTIAVAMAFDDAADLLAGFAKGDNVEIVGTVSAGIWQGNPQLKVTVAACRRPQDDRPKRVTSGPRPDVAPTSPRARSHLQAVR